MEKKDKKHRTHSYLEDIAVLGLLIVLLLVLFFKDEIHTTWLSFFQATPQPALNEKKATIPNEIELTAIPDQSFVQFDPDPKIK